MTTFRPAVKEDDGYVQKVIKYIPTEIVTGYTALVGYLSVGTNTDIPHDYKTYYIILLCILGVATPVWTYYGVLDNNTSGNNFPVNKRALFQSVIATFSFAIWVYTIGNPILKSILCNCINTGCADCGYYSPVLGSIILVLFTIMTPLIERIVLGTKLPTE